MRRRVKQTPSNYGNPLGRQRVRSTSPATRLPHYPATRLPCGCSSLECQVANKVAAPVVPLATAQLLRRRPRKLRVCLGCCFWPAPSLLRLLIKQVSCRAAPSSPSSMPHPRLPLECSQLQAGGRNVNAVTQFALAMSLFRFTLFMLYDFSHAQPAPRPPLVALKARLWQHLARRDRVDSGRRLAAPLNP